VWQDDDEVVVLHRQNQVRQLKDTWPIDGLCIYNYQLAPQVRQNRQVHPSRLDSNRTSDVRLAKHPEKSDNILSAHKGLMARDTRSVPGHFSSAS
jgi:hypothetical protein